MLLSSLEVTKMIYRTNHSGRAVRAAPGCEGRWAAPGVGGEGMPRWRAEEGAAGTPEWRTIIIITTYYYYYYYYYYCYY